MDIRIRIILWLAATLVASLIVIGLAHAGPFTPAGVPSGTWCQTDEDDSWMYFERGTACSDTPTLTLKPNGDYILAYDHELSCKASPKSHFKGWADYTCERIGEKRKGSPFKVRQKMFTTFDDRLAISTRD